MPLVSEPGAFFLMLCHREDDARFARVCLHFVLNENYIRSSHATFFIDGEKCGIF